MPGAILTHREKNSLTTKNNVCDNPYFFVSVSRALHYEDSQEEQKEGEEQFLTSKLSLLDFFFHFNSNL